VTVDRNRFDCIDQTRGTVRGIGTDFPVHIMKCRRKRGK
jgi:hypothetical protein